MERPRTPAPAAPRPATLRCPACATPWVEEPVPEVCPGCERPTPIVDGVPILVRDLSAIEDQIAAAKGAGRAAWYEQPQSVQWTGPYRHHLAKRIAYVEDAIERFAPGAPEERLGLDVGCGDGEHHAWLRSHVGQLHASDYNLLRLRRAAARGRAELTFLADLTDYPTRSDAYDLVFCNHVLEHVPDDLRALRELRRVLSPDGIVVLGVPNEGAAFWRLAYRLQPRTRATTDHVHFYTASALRERCSTAGFDVLEVHPIGWGLPHWHLDARVRGAKRVDDVFEAVGRRLLPGQATSLYLVLRGSRTPS